jgi:hypothetical protein
VLAAVLAYTEKIPMKNSTIIQPLKTYVRKRTEASLTMLYKLTVLSYYLISGPGTSILLTRGAEDVIGRQIWQPLA